MIATPTHPTVLLIGASRGLGCALAREYLGRGARVVATVRGAHRTALHDLLPAAGGRLEIEHADINEPGQMLGLHDRLAGRTFDLLFVNAGVTNGPDETVADVTDAEFIRLMVTNALSPMRVIERLGGLVAADGTIAIMSSGQGSIANNEAAPAPGCTWSTISPARSPGELSRAASSPHAEPGHRARTLSSVSASAAVLSSR